MRCGGVDGDEVVVARTFRCGVSVEVVILVAKLRRIGYRAGYTVLLPEPLRNAALDYWFV